MNMLKNLRAEMQKQKISAYILPQTDPHGSEYIAPHWQAIKVLTGFTGSAATVVITLKSAALWTDSRYFLQAEEQLKNTEFQLMRENTDNTPSVEQWLSAQLKKGETAAADGKLFSISNFDGMKNELEKYDIKFKNIDILSNVWQNRPEMPKNDFFIHNNLKNAQNKLINNVLPEMEKTEIDLLLLTSLDDIAWLFNIRGADIEYNPVVIAYAAVDLLENKSYLFVDFQKVTNEVKNEFKKYNFLIFEYDDFFDYVKKLESRTIGLDFKKVNFNVKTLISESCEIKNVVSPTTLAKAIKTADELKGLRNAMIKDGVALVKFLRWLENKVLKGSITELSAAQKLHELRKEQKDFFSESFNTISAYGEHAAIVHYAATAKSDVALQPHGLFLLDSGAQYLDGTTDITRTIALGNLEQQQKTDYTLVLKGHIALAKSKFPQGTRGAQLDVLARQFLWQNSLNYGHGTGHGVGHFLCVHEGPQSIRMQENPTILEVGMVTSNEPGIYRAGKWGIRLENLIVIEKAPLSPPEGGKDESDFGKYLCFNTYSLCPFDKNCIDFSLLTADETEWLNSYHTKVFEELSPYLEKEEKEWLEEKCRM